MDKILLFEYIREDLYNVFFIEKEYLEDLRNISSEYDITDARAANGKAYGFIDC